MRNYLMSCLAAAALAAVVSSAEAADGDGNFALHGFGAETCNSGVQRLQGNEAGASAALSWLLGYTTAFNRVQAETFDVSPLTDPTSILRMVIGICRQSPDSMIETVAFDVLRTLARARVTSSSPFVETRTGEAQATVRRETLLKLQAKLVELGHLSDTPDGAFGPKTEVALKAFQQAQELPQSGVADSATIVRLLVELPVQTNQ